MKYDDYGLIVMEQGTYPGNIGDSAAETSRMLILKDEFSDEFPLSYDELTCCHYFQTPQGFVRHPDSPWRENDFSSDQALPLYMAAIATHCYSLVFDMEMSIKKAGWKTGNGDIVSPLFYGILTNNRLLTTICMIVQALLLKLPWRWNDEKKAFETTESSSCDYLNWIVSIPYAYSIVTLFMDQTKAKAKVIDYYQNEPNAIVLPLYLRFIDRMWQRRTLWDQVQSSIHW